MYLITITLIILIAWNFAAEQLHRHVTRVTFYAIRGGMMAAAGGEPSSQNTDELFKNFISEVE